MLLLLYEGGKLARRYAGLDNANVFVIRNEKIKSDDLAARVENGAGHTRDLNSGVNQGGSLGSVAEKVSSNGNARGVEVEDGMFWPRRYGPDDRVESDTAAIQQSAAELRQ